MIRPQEHAREFPGCPESVAQARQFAAAVAGGCPAADAVVLAASELAANAVRWSGSGTAGGTYTVRISVTLLTSVAVFVVDSGGRAARFPQADGLEGGRGLRIVAAISQAWGLARPGVGAWTGAAAGEPRTAAGLAAARGGTCAWFRAGWHQAGDPADTAQAGGEVWLEVMARASWRCECAGACGRPGHRCPAGHVAGHPLHLVPVLPVTSAAATALPAAALAALCPDCHAGAARAAAREAAAEPPQAALFGGGVAS